MSSILYILITTGFAFLIQIQWCHSHWNWVGNDADIGVAQFSVCVMTGHRRCHSVTLAISWDIGFEHSTPHRQRKNV